MCSFFSVQAFCLWQCFPVVGIVVGVSGCLFMSHTLYRLFVGIICYIVSYPRFSYGTSCAAASRMQSRFGYPIFSLSLFKAPLQGVSLAEKDKSPLDLAAFARAQAATKKANSSQWRPRIHRASQELNVHTATQSQFIISIHGTANSDALSLPSPEHSNTTPACKLNNHILQWQITMAHTRCNTDHPATLCKRGF